MILLPLLALGQALYGSSWGTVWFLARQRAGIEQFPFIMPAFSEVSGQWLPRRMTSVEGSLWLREFLVRAGVPEQEAGKYSSHSLKSTLLSWSALHGSLSMDERRAMGHHFDGRLAIPLVYSRDFLCQIHVKLLKMFQQIRAGVFDPEESRVQRIGIARETASDILPEEVSSGSDVEKEDCNPQKSLPVATSEPDFPRTIMPQEDFERCRQHKLSGVVHCWMMSEVCRVAERCQEIMDPLSLRFTRLVGKCFASSVPKLSTSESRRQSDMRSKTGSFAL